MPILDKDRIILDQITTLISRSDPSLARRVSNSMAISLLQQLVAITIIILNLFFKSCQDYLHIQQNHHDHYLGQVLGPVLGGLNLQATGRTLPHDEDPEVVHNKPGCCTYCKIKHTRSELYLRARRVLPHFSQRQRWVLLSWSFWWSSYWSSSSAAALFQSSNLQIWCTPYWYVMSWWWRVHVLDLERAGAPRSQRGDAPDDQEQGNQVHDTSVWWWW